MMLSIFVSLTSVKKNSSYSKKYIIIMMIAVWLKYVSLVLILSRFFFAMSFSHIYSYCLITFIIKMTMQVNLSIFWDGKQNTYSSYIVNRLSPYFYLLIFREQVNNSLFSSLACLPSVKGISSPNRFFFLRFLFFFSLFQVVSHFHSLDGNIRIEAMHKSNEAKPRTIKCIACKMEILF